MVWLITGRLPTKPSSTPLVRNTSPNGVSAPRLKKNSGCRLGRDEAPAPLSIGSPVWSMKLSITRKNTRPS